MLNDRTEATWIDLFAQVFAPHDTTPTRARMTPPGTPSRAFAGELA